MLHDLLTRGRLRKSTDFARLTANCVIASLLLTTSVSAQAAGFPSGAQLKSIVNRSHVAAIKVYKMSGFEGMMNAIRACYARLPKQVSNEAIAECASLDLSAFYIEQGASQEFRAVDEQTDDYMSGDKFENRMDRYLPPHTGKSSDLMDRHANFAAMVHAYRGN